jgi:hypothetical protein
MRDISRTDWDWVYLQTVVWDGERYQASYVRKGGMGDLVTVPASDFRREFRRMLGEG